MDGSRDLPGPMRELRFLAACTLQICSLASPAFTNTYKYSIALEEDVGIPCGRRYSVAMLVRSVPRCATKLRLPPSRANLRCSRLQCRKYSMPASGHPSSSLNSAGMLAPFCNELDRIAPSFKVDGSQIQILRTPAEFYETIKVWKPRWLCLMHAD